MKVFLAITASLISMALADQSSHQTVRIGNAAPIHTSVHKPHGSPHASVISQPAASPQDIHNPYAPPKPIAKIHSPAHIPLRASAAYKPAPIKHSSYKPAPYAAPIQPISNSYQPAILSHIPAQPAYKPAPAPIIIKKTYKPAPYAPKPISYKPAAAPHIPAPAAYKPAPAPIPAQKSYKPAPYISKPASYHAEPEYDAPAVYNYGYAVADDYSGANFAQNENRDGYATNGEYRVALPDGRTQIVTYSVGDAYSGYIADVKYEGEAHYEPYVPAPKPTYAPKLVPIHA